MGTTITNRYKDPLWKNQYISWKVRVLFFFLFVAHLWNLQHEHLTLHPNGLFLVLRFQVGLLEDATTEPAATWAPKRMKGSEQNCCQDGWNLLANPLENPLEKHSPQNWHFAPKKVDGWNWKSIFRCSVSLFGKVPYLLFLLWVLSVDPWFLNVNPH